jgi:nicotinamidase-related amidase
MAIQRLNIGHTAILVVDMQERLLPAMHEKQGVIDAVSKLIDGSNALGVPILVTEQYRKGLGTTIAPIAQKLESAVCNEEKLKFSSCIKPILDSLRTMGARSVVVCGIEAHVCVLQTCLDLLDSGFVTAVAVDATASRRVADRDAAIERMIQAGVLPVTVESALLELVHEAGTASFKAILPIIK